MCSTVLKHYFRLVSFPDPPHAYSVRKNGEREREKGGTGESAYLAGIAEDCGESQWMQSNNRTRVISADCSPVHQLCFNDESWVSN